MEDYRSSLGHQPIPGSQPAGHPVRDGEDFYALREEINRDAIQGTTDWRRVVDLASAILEGQSKDFVVACYLVVGLARAEGLPGLVTGLVILADLVDHYWTSGFPEVTRLRRARRRAFAWMNDHLLSSLESIGAGPTDRAELGRGLDAISRLEGGPQVASWLNLRPLGALLRDALDRVPDPEGATGNVVAEAPTPQNPSLRQELSAQQKLRAERIERLCRSPRRIAGQGDAAGDRVACAVYAPPRVSPNQFVLVQVLLHEPKRAAEAEAIALEYDEDSRRRGLARLDVPIPRGTCLVFELSLRGAAVRDRVLGLVWEGETTQAAFEVAVPESAEADLIGRLIVSQDCVPIGRIVFKLKVMRGSESAAEPVEPIGRAQPFGRAFISYASSDRVDVMKRVQLLAALGVEFFQDLLSLDPGERWERALYREIDRADLFLLFWSTAAHASSWVGKELAYALERKSGRDENPPEIIPVILEGPPPPPRPNGLDHLHFDDRFLFFLREGTALVDTHGGVICPRCDSRFSIHDEEWSDSSHASCGQRLQLVASATAPRP